MLLGPCPFLPMNFQVCLLFLQHTLGFKASARFLMGIFKFSLRYGYRLQSFSPSQYSKQRWIDIADILNTQGDATEHTRSGTSGLKYVITFSIYSFRKGIKVLWWHQSFFIFFQYWVDYKTKFEETCYFPPVSSFRHSRRAFNRATFDRNWFKISSNIWRGFWSRVAWCPSGTFSRSKQ